MKRRTSDSNGSRRPRRRRFLIAALVAAALAGVGVFAVTALATTSVDFSFLPSNPQPGDSVTFTITTDNSDVPGAHYIWSVDGSTIQDSTSTTFLHTFATAGSYDVKVLLEDGSNVPMGDMDHTVVVNTPPTAAFTFSPTTPNPGDTVSFDGSGSSDPEDTTVTSYAWDLDNDGQFDDSTAQKPTKTFTAGTHTVSLQVTDSDGGTDTISKDVTVNTPPTAAFTSSPAHPTPGATVSFDGTGSSDPEDTTVTSYSWDLNDDGVYGDSTASKPTTTFATAGPHPVSLEVTDSNGATNTVGHLVTVNAPPTADFTFTPTTPNPGDTISLDGTSSTDDGSIASYSWDTNDDGTFGDKTGATPTISFATAGTHTVTLRVTDNDGATDTVSKDITVNNPPTAAFTFTPTTPNTGDTINLDGTGSTDPEDGSVTSYSWDLNGDGTFGDSTSSTPTTSFATAGTHTVKLRVTDSNDATDTITHTITVNHPPTAAFTSSPAHPTPGATVSFDGTGSTDPEDGSVTSYAWDLDNNGTFTDSTDSNPTTTFGTAGSHTVTLRVTDSNGATNTISHTVNVNAPPSAAFTSSPAHPIPNQTVSFNGTGSSDSDGSIAGYSWDLNNDGTFGDSTSATPTTSFATAGTHTVKLRVTDNFGATNTVTHDVTVNAVPTAAFTFTPTHPDPNQSINLDGTGSSDPEDGSVTSYSWDLNNDGTFGDSTSATPNTSFSASGPHTVKLKVTDSDGATSPTLSQVITVNGPSAEFNWTPVSPVSGQVVTFQDTSTDTGGAINSIKWDLNNDGSCGDDPGETDAAPTRSFPAPGNYTVTECVFDNHGRSDTISHVVTVANRPPTASFVFGPTTPLPGDLVTFTSTSSDPDGPIASTAWDLNGNNIFGELGETGSVVSRSFPAAGTYPISLQVTDQNGATTKAFDSVTVLAPPSSPVKPRTTLPINPFPIVTIRGKLTRTGVKITSLVVQTPVGTTVTIRCKGRHCPFKSTASIAKVRKLKVKKLQRSLRGDMVLELFITRPGEIGKYTRFHIRTKGKGPVRQDKCLSADTNVVQRCPS